MTENSMSVTEVSKANIAVNRFGYGARENELEQAKGNPKQWVKSQLQTISFNDDLPDSHDILLEHVKYQQQKKQQKKNGESQADKDVSKDKGSKRFARKALRNMSADSLQQAINSPHSVSWRLLDFFSNHFSVTAQGRLMVGLAATLEREAIAPHLLGNFTDMLLAVEQHPAMLVYLNNDKSFGPNSKMAKRSKRGLNENLAREIMELHTLGVDGGYSQEDVVELAKGITGWSVKRPKRDKGTGFIFRTFGHEPGTRKLLGKSYAQNGISQGREMLRDIAKHPATAKHICYKLAHHFVDDTPSASLLNKMETTWKRTGGNIKQVMFTLFDADEAWLSSKQKFKTPREFVISTYRGLAHNQANRRVNSKALLKVLSSLGQQPFNAGSPAGYSDEVDDWLGPSALMARIDWSTSVSGSQGRINSEKLMSMTLGSSVSELTYNAVLRAESRQTSLTLLLMSPEFQRR